MMEPEIRLRARSGAKAGKVWTSSSHLRIGRDTGMDVVLEANSVSRHHAEIRNTLLGWQVGDLGSINGTFLNGRRLGTGEWSIEVKDILEFAEDSFVIDSAWPTRNSVTASPEAHAHLLEKWFQCNSAWQLLSVVARSPGYDARLRLLACACARWKQGNDYFLDCELVFVAERFARGKASRGEMSRALHAAWRRVSDRSWALDEGPDANLTALLFHTQRRLEFTVDWFAGDSPEAANLCRCLFPPPTPINVDPSWLAWNDRTVPRIARGIVAGSVLRSIPSSDVLARNGRPNRKLFVPDVPILGDALLDAGCDESAILMHCREPLHTPDCWVLKLLE